MSNNPTPIGLIDFIAKQACGGYKGKWQGWQNDTHKRGIGLIELMRLVNTFYKQYKEIQGDSKKLLEVHVSITSKFCGVGDLKF